MGQLNLLNRNNKILLIEDDPSVRQTIRAILSRQGFDLMEAARGALGLQLARRSKPDLILLDWVLGRGPQGVDICARLKRFPETRPIPIIVLTGARVEFQDELLALRHGADLYLTKESVTGDVRKLQKFLCYVESLLDRSFKLYPPRYSFARRSPIVINLSKHIVKTPKELINNFPTKLFDLLYLLARRHPRIVSRKYLVHQLWNNHVRDREVDVAVCRLKTRLEKGGEPLIESVVRKGYRLRVPIQIVG